MRTRINIIKSTLAMIVLCQSATALAAVPVPFGWYLEGNIGTASTQSVDYGNGTSDDNKGFSWNLNLGYKFIPFFGVEIGYTNYSNNDVKYGSTKVAKDSRFSADIAGVGILPFSNSGFAVIGKLGAAKIHSEVTISNQTVVTANGLSINTGTHTTTGLYLGLGGEYAFMPNLLGVLQWQRARGDSSTGDIDLYSAGLNYVFG